jgi:hypothetical protein
LVTGDACKESKDFQIPCDQSIHTVVWGPDLIRRNRAGVAGGYPQGAGVPYEYVVTSYDRDRRPPPPLTRPQVVHTIRTIDKDLWIRLNAWVGNWRKGLEATTEAAAPTPEVSYTADVNGVRTRLTVQRPNEWPGWHHNNVAPFGGLSANMRRRLEKYYGSYLPNGRGRPGKDQIRCAKDDCVLDLVVAREDRSGTEEYPEGFHLRSRAEHWRHHLPYELRGNAQLKFVHSFCIEAQVICWPPGSDVPGTSDLPTATMAPWPVGIGGRFEAYQQPADPLFYDYSIREPTRDPRDRMVVHGIDPSRPAVPRVPPEGRVQSGPFSVHTSTAREALAQTQIPGGWGALLGLSAHRPSVADATPRSLPQSLVYAPETSNKPGTAGRLPTLRSNQESREMVDRALRAEQVGCPTSTLLYYNQ